MSSSTTPALLPARSPVRIPVRYFDGRNSQAQAFFMQLHKGFIELSGEDGAAAHRYAIDSVQLAEPWPGQPTPVALPDGATLWLPADASALQTALRGGPASLPARAVRSWPAVLVALLVLVSTVVWFDRQGAGLLAHQVVRWLPWSAEVAFGDKVWVTVSGQWFVPSRHTERCHRLGQQLIKLAPAFPGKNHLSVDCRRTLNGAGFNAFALPGGRIVVLDGMLEKFTDDEVMAVLGHELGHVVHRHGMQALVRSSGLLALAHTVRGDVSAVAVGMTTSLQSLAYSRDAEREADAFALDFAKRANLPSGTLSRVWDKLQEEQYRSGGGLPLWLSSHPSTEERRKASDPANPAEPANRQTP
jgi:Zn-dependent protease with chaperone function